MLHTRALMRILSLTLPLWLALPGVAAPQQRATRSDAQAKLDVRLAEDLWVREELLGDPLGWRTYGEQRGVDARGELVFESFGVLSGGRRRSAAMLGLLDVEVEFDLGLLAELPGASALVRIGALRGDGVSDDIGSLQRVSDIETEAHTSILELWYAYELEESAGFRVGKIDAGRDFARLDSDDGYLNNSVGLGDGLFPFPTDPSPAMGATGYLGLGLWRFALGLFNAADPSSRSGALADPHAGLTMNFDETLWLAELSFDWAASGSASVGRAALGYWRHNARFDLYGGGSRQGEEGLYLVGEQEVWRAHGRERGAGPSLVALGQLTLSDADAFPIERNLGAGFRLDGASAARPRDSSGFFVSIADLSGVAGSGTSGFEVAAELFHRMQLTPAVALTPDLQVLLEPAGEGSDAIVLGLRLELSL